MLSSPCSASSPALTAGLAGGAGQNGAGNTAGRAVLRTGSAVHAHARTVPGNHAPRLSCQRSRHSSGPSPLQLHLRSHPSLLYIQPPNTHSPPTHTSDTLTPHTPHTHSPHTPRLTHPTPTHPPNTHRHPHTHTPALNPGDTT